MNFVLELLIVVLHPWGMTSRAEIIVFRSLLRGIKRQYPPTHSWKGIVDSWLGMLGFNGGHYSFVLLAFSSSI